MSDFFEKNEGLIGYWALRGIQYMEDNKNAKKRTDNVNASISPSKNDTNKENDEYAIFIKENIGEYAFKAYITPVESLTEKDIENAHNERTAYLDQISKKRKLYKNTRMILVLSIVALFFSEILYSKEINSVGDFFTFLIFDIADAAWYRLKDIPTFLFTQMNVSSNIAIFVVSGIIASIIYAKTGITNAILSMILISLIVGDLYVYLVVSASPL